MRVLSRESTRYGLYQRVKFELCALEIMNVKHTIYRSVAFGIIFTANSHRGDHFIKILHESTVYGPFTGASDGDFRFSCTKRAVH